MPPHHGGREIEMLTYTRRYAGACWGYWASLVGAVLFALAWVS